MRKEKHLTTGQISVAEAETLKFISGALSESVGNYEFAAATNGFEASLELGSFQPGLLILDLVVPDLDSLEVCRSVKANPATRHTKILVLAESSQRDKADEALAAGSDDHLYKPLEIVPGINNCLAYSIHRRKAMGGGSYALVRFLLAVQIEAQIYEPYGLTEGEIRVIEGPNHRG